MLISIDWSDEQDAYILVDSEFGTVRVDAYKDYDAPIIYSGASYGEPQPYEYNGRSVFEALIFEYERRNLPVVPEVVRCLLDPTWHTSKPEFWFSWAKSNSPSFKRYEPQIRELFDKCLLLC